MTTDTETAETKKPVNIFVGSKGLRAGWGVLLFIAVLVALFACVHFGLKAVSSSLPRNGGPEANAIFGEGTVAVLLIVATLITAALERRPLAQLGLGLTNAVPRFVQGLVIGFGMLSALIGVLYLCHDIVIDKIALQGSAIFTFGGLWFLAFLLVGIAEEFCFRVYLQQTIARGLNFRIASVIMGGLFVFAHTHNQGETPIGLGLVFAAAILFAVSIWRTGTVWWAIGFHAAWDWAQSFFWGTPDSGLPAKDALMTSHAVGPAWLSGGTTGPEGSVLAIGAMLLSAVIIYAMAPKQDEKLDVRW